MSYFYGLILLFFSLNVNAFSIPYVTEYGFNDKWFSTGQEACDYVKQLQGNLSISYVYERPNCIRGGSIKYTISERQVSSCPANSTKSGTSCTCNSGYIEQGSQCVQKDPCDGLAEMCSGSQGKTGSFSYAGKNVSALVTCMSPLTFGGNALPGCNRGCLADVSGYPIAFENQAGAWITKGTAKYSGGTCDPAVINKLNEDSDPGYEPPPNPEPAKPPESACPNGFPGEVNGVTVCVPPKSSSGTTEMESKDNGDGTKTDSKTDVKCENGKCEITKTTTTINTTNNSTIGTTSSSTTVDKTAYCSQNKTAGVCKDENGDNPDGTGSFTGNCDAGFQCKGDAVQCAIAKEQHRRMCQIFDDKSSESKLFNQLKGKEGIQRGDEGSPIDLTGRISTDSLIGAGSCMPDFQIQFMDRPVNVKLSNLCPYLEMLGNILVAVGMVMAIRIVGVR